MDKAYSIRMVAQLSGLTPYVIRAWEKRYGVVEPQRTEGNQRLYSDADVTRLKSLSEAVKQGYKIGRVAFLSNRKISKLIGYPDFESVRETSGDVDPVSQCLATVSKLDSSALDDLLKLSVEDLGIIDTIDRVIKPLMDLIGEGWHSGQWDIFHEHLASSTVRSFLGRELSRVRVDAGAPSVIVTTPSGQSHELGSLAVALVASLAGYRTIYLGPSVPAAEVVKATEVSGAEIVLFSIVFPGVSSRIRGEVQYLRRNLPKKVRLVLGGSSIRAIEDSDAWLPPRNMREFFDCLSKDRLSGKIQVEKTEK